jgi:nucleoside-diphosphate-sugar epimerase
MPDTVLVTGATGWIAQHCILQLLEEGYDVRGTARASGRTDEIAAVLAPHLSATARERLPHSFNVAAADLTRDEGWDDAVDGCRYVLHVASPFPSVAPKHEDEVIIPAREGALRVLRAASRANVRRVVLTSSVGAVMYGRKKDHVFTEDDWSDVTSPTIGAYEKSKTLAERAAWEFMGSLPSESTMELAVICPGLVLGPLLANEWSLSGEAVKKIIDRAVPAIPDLRIVPIDVRDVAFCHVKAMTTPEAAGQRLICSIESHNIREMAHILSEHLSPLGFKIPTGKLPSFVMPIVALWDKQVRLVVDDLGQPIEVDNAKIKRVLGVAPRDLREMTVSMADSMIEYGVVAAKR